MTNETEYNRKAIILLFNKYPELAIKHDYFGKTISKQESSLEEIYLEIINDEDLLQEYELIENELNNNNNQLIDIVLVKPDKEIMNLIKKKGWKLFILQLVEYVRYKKDQFKLLNLYNEVKDCDRIISKLNSVKKSIRL